MSTKEQQIELLAKLDKALAELAEMEETFFEGAKPGEYALLDKLEEMHRRFAQISVELRDACGIERRDILLAKARLYPIQRKENVVAFTPKGDVPR